MYVAICVLGFHMAFVPHTPRFDSFFAAPFEKLTEANIKDAWPLVGALTYTFLGGYIWTIQYLIRRIANFDLAPISFFQAFTHVAFLGCS